MRMGGSTPRLAVGLIRVSTAEQGNSGLGLEAQQVSIRSFVAAQGWTMVAEFSDVASGISAAMMVVPLPLNGSYTAWPGEELFSMGRRMHSTGFWVPCTVSASSLRPAIASGTESMKPRRVSTTCGSAMPPLRYRIERAVMGA